MKSFIQMCGTKINAAGGDIRESKREISNSETSVTFISSAYVESFSYWIKISEKKLIPTRENYFQGMHNFPTPTFPLK